MRYAKWQGKPLSLAGIMQGPEGTVEIVTKLTAAETKKYWEFCFHAIKNGNYCGIRADKSMDRRKSKRFLAKVPAEQLLNLKGRDLFSRGKTHIQAKREKKNATKFIRASLPCTSTPAGCDYNAFVLAMRIFSMRHFIEIRTNRTVCTYAPGSRFSEGKTPYANFSVLSTTELINTLQ
jgi:hypothetical protein